MRVINILAAAAAVSLAGTAAAKDKPGAPKEKKICQIVESANGRIPERRICKTKAEWDAAAKARREARSGGRD